jgi:hypothetical protein
MALPRSVDESNKQMCNAAVERLRTEFGMKITKHCNCAPRIAEAIRTIDPDLPFGDPMAVIRAWVALKPSDVVPARLLLETGRVYSLGDQMRLAATRATFQPRMVSMSSKVLYSPEFA